ncbi:hypothetical protein I4U23_000280 [Adineta vaga]|nr:hypothetical protein I4U23_000280 [Adineta vaga]
MKLLYETLNPALILDSNRLNRRGLQIIPPLEPRRSNPLDRYQLPQNQWQIPSSKPSSIDYHVPPLQNGNKQQNPTVYENISNDDEPTEQYLQVDPRCYVRQNSNNSVIIEKRSDIPRLEKGYTINIDTRPSGTSSLSPYRQSSFDVNLAYHTPPQQPSTPSSMIIPQQEMYFTPRGSSLSVQGNPSTSTPPGSQHLSPPVSIIKRCRNSNTSPIRSSIVQREHEHSRSLEDPTSPNSGSVDKQSRSFDAANLLRPVNHRSDLVVNRRTKSYECAEEHHTSSPIAPPPIVIKIPDMSQLVQAVQLSQLDQNIRKSDNKSRKDFWRIHHSYEIEDRRQQQMDQTSPDDLFTSTSIDSAAGMFTSHSSKKTKTDTKNDDTSNYDHRRKSSSNLLLPPPEVRRQALRRTYEKRRNCINQSNARREEQANNLSTTLKSSDFSNLLNNLNCKSENSSFDRSLETDFDMQSDTSSRGQNDHFTSIESSGNEYNLPEMHHHRLRINSPSKQPQQDDSAYKSFESQNQTLSLDWMSTDGAESVIFIPKSSLQQRSVDVKDLEDDLNEHQSNSHQLSAHVYQRSLSTNIPLDEHSSTNVFNQFLSPNTNKSLSLSPSFHRTASKKRKEFSKDKRHATSTGLLPCIITTNEHEYNQNSTSSASSLQIRHNGFQRSKSNETEILDVSPPAAPIRTNITPNPRHLFQKSPSVSVSSRVESFRSKRGSMSFDHPTSPINSSSSNPQHPASISPILTSSTTAAAASGTKSRLKFSLVREPTTSSLGSTSTNHSMLLLNENTIDEKTNRIINEFLMQDENKKINSNNQHRSRLPTRQQTFDETIMNKNDNHLRTKQQTRTAFIKQRPHSFIQTNLNYEQQPSIHLPNRYNKHDNDQEQLSSPSSTFPQQSVDFHRRNNGIPFGSPSIIVTGYDSGS